MAKQLNETFADNIIAADDASHSMDDDDWLEFGKELHSYISDHIGAEKQHRADIQGYTTVDDVVNHDLTQYWP